LALTGRRVTRELLITELLEAAWLRVEHGPFERKRSGGPFDLESLGGSAALAAADLIVCERHALTQELSDENASVEVLLNTPLARYAADAASSLIAFAYTIGQPRTASRRGLGLLLSKAIGRDLDTLSFDAAPYGYDDAAESLGRITDALINHGAASLGPIVIIAPATDAIANVIAVTVANLLDWRAFDDDEDLPVHLG
jgi:phage-related minor tail protein